MLVIIHDLLFPLFCRIGFEENQQKIVATLLTAGRKLKSNSIPYHSAYDIHPKLSQWCPIL